MTSLPTHPCPAVFWSGGHPQAPWVRGTWVLGVKAVPPPLPRGWYCRSSGGGLTWAQLWVGGLHPTRLKCLLPASPRKPAGGRAGVSFLPPVSWAAQDSTQPSPASPADRQIIGCWSPADGSLAATPSERFPPFLPADLTREHLPLCYAHPSGRSGQVVLSSVSRAHLVP